MPIVPSESSAEKLPWHYGDVLFPHMAGWLDCLFVFALGCVAAALCSAILLLAPGHDLVMSTMTFLVLLGMDILFVVCANLANRAMAPEATRLNWSQDGRMLLREGSRLLERREHIRAICLGPFPIMALFDELADRELIDLNAKAMIALLWSRHAVLECDLRDRQERHLRGEKVAIVGRLSDRTP